MKKFLSMLLTLTLVVGMLSAFTVSAAVNTTTFYNAETGAEITSLDGVSSIYATTTFTGRYENNASVIISHYDFDGKLTKVEPIVPVESTIGAEVSYTTPEFSVADTDIVKLFVWTGVDTIKPLLKFPGVISRSIPLPTATVETLDVATITDVPLTFAMNFKADPVTKAQLLAYGNWYADYELKINKDVTFNLNGTKDAYLAGQYDSWSPAWVSVPKKEVTLPANTPLKIMETGAELYGEPGLKYTCIEVFDRVKDFDCGVFFSDEFLAANPDIYVTLELRIYNPLDESESYLINEETYEFGTRPSVDKFTGKDVTLTHTLETIEGGELTVSLADLFDAVGPEIYDETVTVTVDGATVNNVADDWTQTTVDFTTPGEYTVTVTDNNYCKVATATVTVVAPAAVDKWTATNKTIVLTVDTVGVDQTVNFADLFTAVDGAVIKTAEVTVTGGTYADGVITVPGTAGTYTVTVTDNFYCNTATATIVVNDAANVDKFTGKDIEVTHTLATIESNVYTVNFSDLFDTNGYEVKDITVTGGTYADGKVTVEGLGTITVTATDNFYCNVATATITVNAPAAVDKWTATNKEITLTVDTVGVAQTVNFADLFTAVDGAIIKDVAVTVDGGSYADGVITVPGVAGTYTVTVTDNFYCNTATATIVVNDAANVDKFTGKDIVLTHTVESIDGGKVTATLADLFTAVGPVIMSQDVTVTVDGATVNKVASDWTQTTVDFTTPGEYTVTITDNYYCNIATATVTVAEPAAVDKFVGKDIEVTHTLATIESNVYTVDFADLFDTNGYEVKDITVTGGTYADGKVTVEGLGTITVTATDNFYCNVATATITVKEPASVDKFTGKTVILTHTLDTIENGVVTATLDDLFTMVDPTLVKPEGLTVGGDGTHNEGIVSFAGTGTFTVTITDNFYCNTATATVVVNAPAAVDKWTATNKTIDLTVNTVGVAQTVNFSDLFTAVDGAIIKDVAVTVTGGSYADGVITVPGTAGTYTVTVTDNFYCNTATATITVNDAENVDKFTGKDIEVTHTLATIESNVYTVNFSDLFDTNGYEVKDITVTGGTYVDGKVTVEGLGTITVTATDNFYCNVATATITVNAPAAVDKWTATNQEITLTVDTVGVAQTVNFADLFTAVDGAIIKDVAVTVDGGSYADGVITVPGVAGTYTVTVTDNFYCNTATATIVVNDAANVDKFTGRDIVLTHTVESIDGGKVTATLADLFTAVGPVIMSQDVTVTVDGATVNKVASDWTQTTVDFTTPGEYTVTITDNYYCNIATATVTVAEPAAVDKFVGKDIEVTHTLATIESNVYTVNFSDLFDTNGYEVKEITVTGGTYADGKVTVEGLGTITVTATDNFYCNVATATITVNAPAAVDKWTATNKTIDLTVNTVGANQTVNFADLFTAVDGAIIKDVAVTVDGGSYTDGVITVPGTAGTYTVTATDNFYCNTATATITVNDAANVDKFTGKTVSKKLAYGSNTTTVTLGELFTAGSYTIKDVTVTGGTYAKGATWDKGTVTVTGTGTFTITITDNYYCNTAKATLTVAAADPINKFTAKNPTVTHTLASIDAKAVSVKLGDIFSGTNVVTGNITVTIAGQATTVTAADWANATVTIPGTTGDVTVTINDNNTCITATGKVTLKAPANQTKWTATNQTVQLTLNNAGQSQTLKFSELFTAVSGAYIKTPVVTVSGGGSYANNAINVPGTAGTYTVTVTDNFYCNTTTATVTVVNPANVTKWTAKTGLAYEIEAGASKTLTLGDIFTLNNNYKVGNVTYTVEELVDNGSATAANWATTPITFTEGGTYTVTITDDLFSDGTYTAEVKITEKVVEPVQKFTVKDSYYLVAHDVVDPGSSDVKTIKLGDIFAASGEGTINSANVTVTTSDKVRNIEATITKNASDWTQTTIALKYSGEITLTITDGADCVAASAVVATAPLWVGDVDAGDASDIAQAHYGTKTRTYITTIDIAAGGTATVTVENIPADGVYGIQWRNGYGIHGTPGTAKFTVNGYSDTSTVTSPDWSDAAGTDFLAYLKAGDNTFTVENIGSTPLALYSNINAMSLDKSGYDDEDFLPYLKDNSDGEGGGTVTPPEDTEWPVPELTWNGKFSGHQYFGDYYGNSIVSPLVNGTYAVGAYTTHTITIPDSGYEGVYVLQFKTTSEAAKIKATTADGYYADFNLTEDGWSSSCAQDQLIYLKKGANTLYVQNVGDASFVLTDIDIGYFKSGYETYYMYDVAQKADGTIPN